MCLLLLRKTCTSNVISINLLKTLVAGRVNVVSLRCCIDGIVCRRLVSIHLVNLCLLFLSGERVIGLDGVNDFFCLRINTVFSILLLCHNWRACLIVRINLLKTRRFGTDNFISVIGLINLLIGSTLIRCHSILLRLLFNSCQGVIAIDGINFSLCFGINSTLGAALLIKQ